MEKISFNKFRTETRHKKVNYSWYKANGGRKDFNADKFYIYKKDKLYCMGSFLMGEEAEFFKDNDKGYYWAVGNCGRVVFEVINKQ